MSCMSAPAWSKSEPPVNAVPVIVKVSPDWDVVTVPEPVIVKVSPKSIACVPLSPVTVIVEFDKEPFPIFDNVLLAPLIVLFVNVSVVALPTRVSVDVGNVNVPVF